MRAVVMWARAEMRARRGGMLALVVLIALSGALVMASVAGARRTGDAYRRALIAYDAPDAFVIPTPGQALDLDAVERLPQVRRSARYAFMALGRVLASGELAYDVYPFAPVSGEIGMGRPVVLAGRAADESRPDEVTINPALAERLGLGVGDQLPMAAASPAEARAFIRTGAPPPGFKGQRIDFRVVGITASLDEVVQPPAAASESLNLTLAYYRAHAGSELFQGIGVDLGGGESDVGAFQTGVERLSDQPVPFVIQREISDKIEGAIRPQATALLLFGIFAAVVALLVLAQASTRQAQADALAHGTLRALGMSRVQLVGLGIVPATTASIVGAAFAVIGAVALSPLAPIGIARRAEPAPGVSLDVAVALVGSVVLIALVVTRAAIAAVRVASPWRRGFRPSMLVRVAVKVRASVPSVVGARLALESPRGVAPSRSAIGGTAIAIAAIGIAITFGASLHRVERTSSLYGSPWHVEINGAYGPDLRDRLEPLLAQHHDVAGASSVTLGQVTIDGIGVSAFGIDRVVGRVEPPLLQGTHPSGANDVVLGVKTARRIDAIVGDRVAIEVGSIRRMMRVSGIGVLPALGLATSRVFGEASVFTIEGLRKLIPDAPVNVFFIRLRSGVSVDDARARFPAAFGVSEDEIDEPGMPAEIVNLSVVDYLPFVLAGMLAVLAVATLAHALVALGRARARDLAILRTLGFMRRQVRAAVRWQSTTMAVAALLAGVPAGIAGGRWLWALFADHVGLVAQPTFPIVAAVAAVPAALLAADIVALVPAGRAARLNAAIALRAE